MAERKVQLILEWLEANPAAYAAVRKKVSDLAPAMTMAAKATMLGAKTDEQREATLTALQAVYTDQITAVMRTIPGFAAAEAVQKKLAAQQEEAKRRIADNIKHWKSFGSQISAIGVRLGWLGYRLTMMGRILMRVIMKPISDIINLLRNWERTMGDVAYSIGVLTYTGLGSADMIATLTDTLTRLPIAGLQVQAAFGALEGVMATIAVDLAPILVSILVPLAEAFLTVWKAVSPKLLPALERLVADVLPQLIDIILDVGPAFIQGIIQGLTISVPLIVNFLDAIRPILPFLGILIGALIPFAPILTALGMAFFFISPILMTVGTIITWIAPLFGGLGAMISTLLPPLAAIAAAILVGITVFKLLKGVIGPIPALIVAIVSAIAVGIAVFYGLSAAVGVLTGVATAASPILVGVGTAIGAAGAAASPAIPIILALGAAILMAGAGFALAGVGVSLAAEALITLGEKISVLLPLAPVLFTVSAGMLAVAAAGIAMLPGAVGVAAMSVALVTLAGSILILTAAILALAAAAKAFEAVGGTVGKIVDGLSGALGGLGNVLKKLCFKHAMPMAMTFGKTLEETRSRAAETTSSLTEMATALRRVPAGEAGIGRAGIGGPTTTTIYGGPIYIGTVTGVADLSLVSDAVNKSIGELIRRRR